MTATQPWGEFQRFAYGMLLFIYINFLWILFTFIGLIFFGLFPATSAMFSTARTVIKGKEGFKWVYHYFWTQYKSYFFTMNGYMLLFSLIGLILYYDFYFIYGSGLNLSLLIPILLFILLSFLLTLLMFFPVFSHFKLPFLQYIKQSFLIAATSPMETILIFLVIIVIYLLCYLLPGIIPLFPGSAFAFASTYLALRAFKRIEEKSKKRSR